MLVWVWAKENVEGDETPQPENPPSFFVTLFKHKKNLNLIFLQKTNEELLFFFFLKCQPLAA